MRKGFTLAETLITMAIIGIIMALSIPAVIQNTNDTKPLFKKAYNSVEEIVNEMINDTSLYPTGDLSAPASGAGLAYCSATDLTNGVCFCKNFFSKLNTIGSVTCTAAAAVTPSTANMDATSTNSMLWYNIHSTVAAKATSGFTVDNCDGANGTTNPNLTTIDDTTNTCIKLLVDVNGANKGSSVTAAQDNRDIFTIYITNNGKIAVKTPVSATAVYEEPYILQN